LLSRWRGAGDDCGGGGGGGWELRRRHLRTGARVSEVNRSMDAGWTGDE
jgi:hypothetical protein